MLSLQQAIEIKESIKSYLKASFSFRKRDTVEAFDSFIEQSMFKGPYLSLKLRFVKASKEDIAQIPLTIKPDWPPYDHQVKSWTRLSTHDKKPQPTIVTTGTGSGKTESFLYPVLDYCYQQQHRRGIKVIILYPMNALATDQAKRLAEAIHEDERLQGKITAGLFIGEGSGGGMKHQFPATMGEDHIIEHRDTILDAAPDIILTNFKMLDYALMKHNYHRLWANNLKDPSLLQFLVLDELHTYDGAQGTDVANLIRRLKLKLDMPLGQLCPVGTSATIGSGEDAPQLLADYASKVFGETIDTEALITENRISGDQFFGEDDDKLLDFIPLPQRLKELVFNEDESFDDYLQAHIDIWQQDKQHLARGLMQLKLVKDLVTITSGEQGTYTVQEVMRELSVANTNFRKLAEWDAEHQYSPKERVLESLLTLIASAKAMDNPRPPFMYIQIQPWVREPSGVQYTLDEKASFSFRDQVDAQQEVVALPPWYCRECNSMGWLGVKPENRDVFSKEVNDIYEKFFARNKTVYFLLPGGELTADDLQASGYTPDDFLQEKIHPQLLHILDKKEEGGFPIQALRKLSDNRLEHICPCCNSSGTIAIIGTKIPTLSSIAVSQTLATDLDPAQDKYRKVLAFTNSVQDAAHQASFIEGRNYRFTLRASIQKVINQSGEALRLDKLVDEFINYWKQHADETGADSLSGYLHRFLPKDYLGKLSPENYRKGDKYYDDFLKEFDTRIQWEIYSEFGFNSLIGRTLEKTGASSIYFDTEKLTAAWEQMSHWLTDNDVSQTIGQDDWLRFSNLVLHRSRQRGAIDHRFLDKFRNNSLILWDLNWQKDTRHYLNPKFGKYSRLPKLLTSQDSKKGLLDTTRTRNLNWFHAYFKKSFVMASSDNNFINEFYETWLQTMQQAGLLNATKAGDQTSYALVADAIWVKKNVTEYHCQNCEAHLYNNDPEALVAGAKCMSYLCTGDYKKVEHTKNNYYKAVYNRSRFPRVYAREHTGLLERTKRERLEIDFKQRPRFNSTNTLVATSTLEMGIDIGTLNTAYNNSVPPLPSNFLQRVGRAGRSSGSALIVNFAKNQNHDLYYYADPMEMMQGVVNTPGCYLEAKEILRRHFTAYCIDSWTSEDSSLNTIPNFMRDLKLMQADLLDSSFFINCLCHFIEQNRVALQYMFLQHYDENIAETIFVEITEELDNRWFYERLLNVFLNVKAEIIEIDKRRKELDDTIKVLQLAKGDQTYEEFTREKRNLAGLKRAVMGRNVLEHLTNVGVLPNYAFPETGVKLNAHLQANKLIPTDNVALDMDFELVRPASQAIKELAPENFFYTQGYRFKVEGINTLDWSDQQNFHLKRFCSKCDNIEIDSISHKGNCPKCGDPSWNAASNVHQFAKLIGVKSYANMGEAILSDASDDREASQYQLMQHVQFNDNTSAGAWILKDIPFGIEYVKNTSITSINYGRSNINDARRLKINESEVLTKGFVTCTSCGKSVSSTHQIERAEDFHFGYCKHRKVGYPTDENQNQTVFKELYLFREFQTEILKIILPIQEFNNEADIRMFQAGIELGLKKYFKGNPGHIRVLSYKEYNKKTDKFDRFLLLYDTIPGGTGYLEQLFDFKEFSSLLHFSYQSIRDCNCQKDDKDGCYKCIFSYGNQYDRSELSRARAEKWFANICSKTEEWVRNNSGLTSITNSGQIEESELEERFVKLLSTYALKTSGIEFESVKQDGIIHYQLSIQEGDIDALYWIQPQIVLGAKDGLQYNTRTDFLITCGKYEINGKDYRDEIPATAIYLDGYQYHASSEHNVLKRDITIRKAIAQSQHYKVWTLTWRDLDLWEQQINGEVVTDELSQIFDNYYQDNLARLLRIVKSYNCKVSYAMSNNMERLLQKLRYPEIDIFKDSWYFYLASWTQVFLSPSFTPDALPLLLTGKLTNDDYLRVNKVNNFDGLLPIEKLPSFAFGKWRIWVNVYEQVVYNNLEINQSLDIDKMEWNTFWTIFNVFQSSIFIDHIEQKESEEILPNSLLEELKKYYPDYLWELIRKAINERLITDENADYLDSYVDDTGNLIADAELVLMNAKIVVAPSSMESHKIFAKHGYRIYEIEQINDIKL